MLWKPISRIILRINEVLSSLVGQSIALRHHIGWPCAVQRALIAIANRVVVPGKRIAFMRRYRRFERVRGDCPFV